MGNVPCGRGSTTDGDAGWKQQNKQQDTNVVYKFMNLQKGGTLIDAYNREQNGLEAVRKIVRDELDSFMYGHGKGKLIRKIDFIKWKRQCKTDLKVSASWALSSYDLVLRWIRSVRQLNALYTGPSRRPVHSDNTRLLWEAFSHAALMQYISTSYYL